MFRKHKLKLLLHKSQESNFFSTFVVELIYLWLWRGKSWHCDAAFQCSQPWECQIFATKGIKIICNPVTINGTSVVEASAGMWGFQQDRNTNKARHWWLEKPHSHKHISVHLVIFCSFFTIAVFFFYWISMRRLHSLKVKPPFQRNPCVRPLRTCVYEHGKCISGHKAIIAWLLVTHLSGESPD